MQYPIQQNKWTMIFKNFVMLIAFKIEVYIFFILITYKNVDFFFRKKEERNRRRSMFPSLSEGGVNT